MLEGSGTALVLAPPTVTEGVGLAEPTPAKVWAYWGLGRSHGPGRLTEEVRVALHPFVPPGQGHFVCFDLVLNRLS
jgi:hypothetical protein